MMNGHLDPVRRVLEFLAVLQGRMQGLNIDNPLF